MGILSFFGIGRGNVKVVLNKTSFAFGETIEGNLEINLKKPITTNYTEVVLRLQEKTTRFRNGKRETSYQTLHEDKVRLANEQSLTPGKILVPFKILIPPVDFPKFSNAGVAQAVKVVGMLMGTSAKFIWTVKGHVDVPSAIDMRSKRIRISVNPAASNTTPTQQV